MWRFRLVYVRCISIFVSSSVWQAEGRVLNRLDHTCEYLVLGSMYVPSSSNTRFREGEVQK